MRISDWSSDVCSSDLSSNVARAHEDSVVAQLLAIIPGSFLGALAGGTCSRCWSHRCFPALPSPGRAPPARASRSEEHTSELQSLMRISYAVFCLKKKKNTNKQRQTM